MSKKIVNSNCPEFGYELLSSIPYAYNLFLKGELEGTVSGFDTSCLYFFSPNHTESDCKRSWDNMKKLWDTKFPNINIHRPQLEWDLFSPPPFKKHYEDKMIKFEKETIVIFNRYNVEWGKPPINYLDLGTLDKLFEMLNENYQVVYINLNKGDKYFDGALPMKLNDDKVLKKYPKVYSLYDVMDMYPELSINEIQLRIFANCSKYISSNGGQLILSAYFGGENIIFSKTCRELDPNVNSFYKWYHKLGDGVFQHVDSYDDLVELVRQKWVLKKPLINILVRTSGRPHYFKDCINSIYEQTYKNWNLIIGVDNKESLKYTQSAKGRDISYNYSSLSVPPPPNNQNYGVKFIYNLYLNDLQNQVNDGFVIYLDDDDKLNDRNSLNTLVSNIKTDDDFLIWRVGFPNRLVPSDENFGKRPVLKDISGIGFSFHIKHKVEWEAYKRGDYRVASELFDKIPNTIFVNEVITKLQRDVEDGFGKKDDKYDIKKKISVIIPTFGVPNYLIECLDSVVKSINTQPCEILVGIDNCDLTIDYIKNKTFDSRIHFYVFNRNVGPYIIKNSLSIISNSDFLLFFDSDDIMEENMVDEVIQLNKRFDFVKPKYINFNDVDGYKNLPKKSNLFGEGVFSINKKLFTSMNGFEPWRTSADTDFMNRLYKNSRKSTTTKNILFYRRIHKNSLTQSKQTGHGSKSRMEYNKLIFNKKSFGPLISLVTEPFYELTIKSLPPIKIIDEVKIKQDRAISVLNDVLSKKQNTNTKVDYDKINEIVKKQGIYSVNSGVKPIRENKPVDRSKIVEIKKDSLSQLNRQFSKVKQKTNTNAPNIFSGNNKRGGRLSN
jgi:glycosyltransferase involved in cell wall biosynthesis